MINKMDGVLLNAYPDSCGKNLAELVNLLSEDSFKDTFSIFYILPTLFKSDLDRGFSVISYELNEQLAQKADLDNLKNLDISLLLDFVINHLSVGSPQFEDLLKNGDDSKYMDFFIDWNRFWEGLGEPDSEGLIVPHQEYLSKLFMRKPGLPVLKVPFPDGTKRFYWNTFYQKTTQDGSGPTFLGQMDLNGQSKKVWDFYEQTLADFKSYGGSIVRLDAFAYLHKEAGKSNFFNEPGTWEYLERLKKMADRHNLVLLPEIHAKHEDAIHKKLSEKGYPVYDFFFPGLVIHTIETGETAPLIKWIDEIQKNGYETVNMLGCHDGIPVLDVKGLLNEAEIQSLINLMQERGGRVKDLYGPDGKKIAYYQVNTTFLSAFGEDDAKLLLARAIQIFMPGTPLVWYLDLFAGSNDYEAADKGGHKEINRTNLSRAEIECRLKKQIVQDQLKLLKFRNNFNAFKSGTQKDPRLTVKTELGRIEFLRENNGFAARLQADLNTFAFNIDYKEPASDWKIL